MAISFDNTEVAFAYKSNKDLKKARFLFSSMGVGWLVHLGTRITPWALRIGLPINGLVRTTLFSQFVGGESLEETKPVVAKLEKFGVKVILDYGVEGKEGEANFEHAKDEFIKVIKYAAHEPNIPIMSVKLTGFIRFGLLEKIHAGMDSEKALGGIINESMLTSDERNEWLKVQQRLNEICTTAYHNNVGIFIDAEETWIQHPVDALCLQMMEKFNKEKVIVFNTCQLYCTDRLQFLKDSFALSEVKGFYLGAKLVRGAYIERERKRAASLGYTSQIHPDKASTDRDYNLAIEFCVEHLDKIFMIIASHNEYSNLYATQLLQKTKHPLSHPHVHFSQLYGMSDNITFNLANEGCPVSKFLPFGPLKDVIPYLMRRAQENSSVSGQTGRELGLIKKELKRRASM